MELNADFAVPAIVHGGGIPWIPSPTAGVDRRMLDRLGGEVARATSIVRYAPGSRFPAHTHGGGEEFLVLDGIFSDETGDMPAGTYVRNPPRTRHAPASVPGCTILVKLWQFDATDRTQVRLDTTDLPLTEAADRPGVRNSLLHRDARETVRLEHWAADTPLVLPLPGGGEFFVLEGSFTTGADGLERWSWLRLPAGATLSATAGPRGCRLWVKTGHLAGPITRPAG